MATPPDVLVIGGGIIGLTSAYFLAKAGLSVEVLDKGDLGREASWAGAGIISPGLFPHLTTTPIDCLRAYSVASFRTFSAELRDETGIDNEFHFSGGIEFLPNEEQDVVDLWVREALSFERLTADRFRHVAPGVRTVEGMIPFLHHMMGQVRNPRHLAALVEACRRRGVRLSSGAPFGWWERDGRGVVAVTADGESRPAGHYLIAAGAWADEVLGSLGYRPGIHPVRGQIVLLRADRPPFRQIILVGKRYLVPRLDGRVLVGSTEEPEAGFEKANTPDGVRGLIDFACHLVSELQGAEVETTWSGLRPGSPDGMPFIGPVPGYPNVVVAAGHFRAGVQLSIGTAVIVRDLITGKSPAVPIDAFRLDRTPDVTARPAFRS